MGPDDAVEAARMLNAKVVVPIHYNTFPVIAQDPLDFARRVKSETSSDCQVLAPGHTLEY
jgi:L-ascorbate metabolism protein UlaG (beta-lactamase superfamily)